MEERSFPPDRADTDDEMIEFLRQSLKDADDGRLMPAREAIASLGTRRRSSDAVNRDKNGGEK
ncbi:MAG TPA: hypothetical protein VJ783_02520 [Pirellulales bacterium]|nr:hypothetical protein [Pirellulales bacterium]